MNTSWLSGFFQKEEDDRGLFIFYFVVSFKGGCQAFLFLVTNSEMISNFDEKYTENVSFWKKKEKKKRCCLKKKRWGRGRSTGIFFIMLKGRVYIW